MPLLHKVYVSFVYLAAVVLAQHASAAPKIAIIGAGVGGTAATHFMRQLQPSWHLELFERDRIGGRTSELFYDGKTLELGASIIHAQNQYVLSLAKEMGLTPVQGDDTGAAFSIYDSNSFVFRQVGSQISDTVAVLGRYGVTPLRYKWLSEEMGRRFSRIYDLQRAGHAYTAPRELWEALDLFNVTQESAADYMQDHLRQGWFSYGAGYFIEELAGAINRINYNQPNQIMNALAGLVSYLPAAQPQVYSIKEGNAALARKLASASNLQAVHAGVAVQAVQREPNGQYTLLAVSPPVCSEGSTTRATIKDGTECSDSDSMDRPRSTSSTADEDGIDAAGSTGSLQEPRMFGPYDGVILATPLEGSGIDLTDVLPAGTTLPEQAYQSTVTTYVTGALRPQYFKVQSLPTGDIFVTNSAKTPFSVIASKGVVSAAASFGMQNEVMSNTQHWNPSHRKRGGQDSNNPHHHHQQQQQQQQQQQRLSQTERQLWKVFSEEPLSEELLQQLFDDAQVIISKAWKAYPRFSPPEEFAPFSLAPGLCFNNALENGASAMEVSAVAAMNCALLMQQALGGTRHAELTRGPASVESVAMS